MAKVLGEPLRPFDARELVGLRIPGDELRDEEAGRQVELLEKRAFVSARFQTAGAKAFGDVRGRLLQTRHPVAPAFQLIRREVFDVVQISAWIDLPGIGIQIDGACRRQDQRC
jgi:hypothetical protein